MPDGTRYRFDHIAMRVVPSLMKSDTNMRVLHRREVWIMPTLVTDRWGNTATYNWNASDAWKLDSIVSSDNRTLAFSYVPGTHRISSISNGTHTWTYTYLAATVGQRLSRVTLPDNSQWTFSLEALRTVMRVNEGASCAYPGDPFPLSGSGNITHPSGAIGQFSGPRGCTAAPTCLWRALNTIPASVRMDTRRSLRHLLSPRSQAKPSQGQECLP